MPLFPLGFTWVRSGHSLLHPLGNKGEWRVLTAAHRERRASLERPCQVFVFQETVWQDTEVSSKFLTPLSLPTHWDLQPCLVYSRYHYLLIMSSSFYRTQIFGEQGALSYLVVASGTGPGSQ